MNLRVSFDPPTAESDRPKPGQHASLIKLAWVVVALCAALSVSAGLGMTFGWSLPGTAGDRALSHLLLEWSAATIALCSALIAFAAWRRRRTTPVLLLATFLPTVALLDLNHALGSPAGGLGWIGSRIWLAIAVSLCLIGLRLPITRQRRRFFVGASITIGVLLVAASLLWEPPFPTFHRVLNLVPFLLFGLAALLYWTLPAGPASPLTLALLFGLVPQLLCQLGMLVSDAPYDPHFMLAHWQKLIAYGMLIAGLLAERGDHAGQQVSEDLQYQQTRRELENATQELQRVDRELEQQHHQRRLAENSLRMLEKAVETMSMGVTITDPQGQILYVNPAEAQMHGYTVEELVYQSSDIFAADPTSTAPSETPQPWTRERLDVTRSGRTFPARLVSDQVRDLQGEVIGTVTICENISERKQIEEALVRRDRILEAVGLAAERLLDDSSWEKSFGDVLERLGQATGVERVYMNLEYESHSSEGITRSWAQPDGDLDETSGIFDLPPRAGLFLRWRARLRHGEILQGAVSSLPEDERTVLEARGVRAVAVVPIFVENDFYGYLSLEDSREFREWSPSELEALKIAAGLLGSAIRKRQTNLALAATEAKFRDLLESANDLIQSVALDGRFLFVNRAWKAVLGYSDEEVQELDLWDIIHPEHHAHCRQVLENILRQGAGAGRIEAVFVAKDGRQITVEGAINCRFHEGKPVATRGIFRDITDRKVVDRMKQEFISVVSHELRTPLTSIIAALGLLKSGSLDGQNERAQDLLNVAHRNSNRLLQLINDLLDIQKLAAHRLAFSIEALTLRPLLESVVQSISSVAEAHKVGVQINGVKPDLRVFGDRQRLSQVLNHLLSNAVKFSPAGHEVSISACRLNQAVRIAVTDRGEGIPEAFKQRLFEQFSQADSSHTRAHGGSGLGLSIVKGLVEGMNGRVSVDSKLGHGTTFYVDLPAAEASA